MGCGGVRTAAQGDSLRGLWMSRLRALSRTRLAFLLTEPLSLARLRREAVGRVDEERS